jgi:hypothetical protein
MLEQGNYDSNEGSLPVKVREKNQEGSSANPTQMEVENQGSQKNCLFFTAYHNNL